MIKTVLLEEEKNRVKAFLETFDLVYEDDIDYTIMLIENDTLIGTASKSKQVIKCVAILEAYQGLNYLSTLMTHMIKQLAKESIAHYFVFTKPTQADLFQSLGLNVIISTPHVTLLEGGKKITSTLKTLKETYHISDRDKACVVINANPMTKGHLHLIKEAAKNHEEVLVFVVSEDKSFFPFEVRFDIITKTCRELEGVTVLPTLDYLVSQATFPKYFLKEETLIKEAQTLMDVLIFKTYYMPIFHIKKRYVGDEPLSPMTNMYNQTMKKYLNDALEIVPRINYLNQVISASTVRNYLKEGNVEKVKPFVVEATYSFLTSQRGRELCETIKHYQKRH
jgi:[citrate (pro-3S)-lyase] ligase